MEGERGGRKDFVSTFSLKFLSRFCLFACLSLQCTSLSFSSMSLSLSLFLK